jgi:hypothetical protein
MRDMQEGAVLFADVSGSTVALSGDRGPGGFRRDPGVTCNPCEAPSSVMNGVFVKSSGDDVLCWFPRLPTP